tara:strand:- start:310 stop:741 length:432 start_codon:yes stop_codon:yes gene_type:complete
MRNIVIFMLFAATTGCAGPTTSAVATDNKPYNLNIGQMAVVQRRVASETLVPSRARVSGVAASITKDGIVEVCGFVSGLEFPGTYGPERAFMGVVGDNIDGLTVFALSGGLAMTPVEQLATERLCAASGMGPGSASLPSPGDI